MRIGVWGQNLAPYFFFFFGLLLLSGCGSLGVSIGKTNSANSTAIKKTAPDKDVEKDLNGDEDDGGFDGDENPDDGSDLPNLGYDDWCRPRYPDGRDVTGDGIGDCVFGYLVPNLAACEDIVGSFLWYCDISGENRRFDGWICCGPV